MSAKFKLNKSSAGTGRLNGSRVSINEGSIVTMLNIDCIIMPHCQESSSYKKLWPQSLIVNRSNNCAEVGQIESHGSLWKLIPCNDSAPGSRIMLQTAEKGELPRYLGPDLDIVDLKVDAAAWNVRTVPVSAMAGDVEDIKGLIVQFELVDGGVGGGGQPHSVGALSVSSQAPQLLVCETSKELHSYSELFLDSIETTEGSGASGGKDVGEEGEEGVHPTYRSWQWEVFPESLMAAELDFLEGFIH
uniref:Uncharacterized protein n=1 Tax=Spumella elongata TaxID=89044 RepID=A0A7S3HCZ5_9STRA